MAYSIPAGMVGFPGSLQGTSSALSTSGRAALSLLLAVLLALSTVSSVAAKNCDASIDSNDGERHIALL